MSRSNELLLGQPVVVGKPNLAPKEEILALIDDVLAGHQLTNNGPRVQELESLLSNDLRAECVLTSSGTTALEILLRSVPKGEVILPSFTFVATAHAVVAAGHRVVFADIDPHSHCLSVESVAGAISTRTTAILPVHLWGNPASPDEFEKLANEHDVALIFDAAHAYGTEHMGESLAQFGMGSAYSLHATKAFSAVEGGFVATTDHALAKQLRAMRTFGMDPGGEVSHWGGNYRMSELHAAVGLANHARLKGLEARNQENFIAYRTRIESSGIGRLIEPAPGNILVPYVVLELNPSYARKRKGIITRMSEMGVQLKNYFASPAHSVPPYIGATANLPVTDAVSRLTVALPTGFQLSPNECDLIAAELVELVIGMHE